MAAKSRSISPVGVDEHLPAHVANCQIIGEKKLLLLGFLCRWPQMQLAFRVLRQRKRRCRERQGRRQRNSPSADKRA